MRGDNIMKFFIDTANVEDIRNANELGVICGVTTNPSLIAKEGRDFKEVIKEYPEYKHISVYGDGESKPKMLINYETSSNKEITLTFIRQENGQYLLSNLSK